MKAGPAELHLVRRREYRGVVDLPILVKLAGGSLAGRARNISMGGLFVESATPLPVGTRITLFVPQIGEIPAEIRWALRGRMGAVFDQPLNPSIKDRLTAILNGTRTSENGEPPAAPASRRVAG